MRWRSQSVCQSVTQGNEHEEMSVPSGRVSHELLRHGWFDQTHGDISHHMLFHGLTCG